MRETKRCSRCILPETFPQITFDDEGVCSVCSNHKPVSVLGEAKLREILQTEKGETYDCVVPISGGKDSTYILYYAVEKLKLRSIAVNFDSGFQSDVAAENMENTCKLLNVPLVVIKADYNIQASMLKEALRVSEIVGNLFGVCGNCETNLRTVAISVAREYRVPFILWGASAFEAIGRHPFLGSKALIREILKRGKSIIKVAVHSVKYCFYSVRQRMQMKVPIRYRFRPTGFIPFPKKGIRVIRFFDYIEWDAMNKASFLKEKLGWEFPSGHEDRFDCLLHCLVNYKFIKECGISVDGFTYSTMIRENRMKREDALLRERRVKERIEKECSETVERVGLKDYKMPKV